MWQTTPTNWSLEELDFVELPDDPSDLGIFDEASELDEEGEEADELSF